VLAAVTERLRNREIAQRLHVSVRTVESHIAALLRKLGVPDRTALIALGTEIARAAAGAPALPAPLTGFVGRQRESGQVTALLDDHRLVTLTGPAGAGKTRLALHVAAATADRYPDGARQADLAPVDAALVGGTLARALGVVPQPGRALRDSLREAAGRARCLLVVDNCEHVVADVATLVADLLGAGGPLRILATSREPLGVPGEVSFPVGPLPVPPARASPRAATAGTYDAVRLFVERAAAASPGFTLTDANAADVATLCRRLDGLPLAIELAAARVRSFPPADLVAHLDRRFDLLAAGARTAPPRHRTLRAAIDWSYALLDDEERELFDQLGVFPSDVDFPAVAAVCRVGDADASVLLRLLPALVDKSLVATTQDGASVRYRLLESLREYAAARLAASGAEPVRRRHADYYLGLAEQAAAHLRGPEQAAWLERLDAEHDHIRAALAWLLERGDADLGLRLALAVWWFWQVRGFFTEGRRWLERLLAAAPHVPDATRAAALRAVGVLAVREGDYPVAAGALRECLDISRSAGDRRQTLLALTGLGMVSWRRGEFDAATRLWQECRDLSDRLSDPLLAANSLNNLALVAREQGDYDRAAALWQECLRLYRRERHTEGGAMALGNLGQLEAEREDYPAATERYARSVALHEQLADGRSLAIELARLGSLAAVRGRYGEAGELMERSLRRALEVGDLQRVAYAHCGRGEVAYLRGDVEAATAAYARARETFADLGEQLGLATAELGTALAATARGDAGAAAALAAAALARFERMGHRKGVAWSHHALARTARLAGDTARASHLDRQAWAAFTGLGSRVGAAACLDGLAADVAGADTALAVRRHAAAVTLRRAVGVPRPAVDRGTVCAALAGLRGRLGAASFAAAWRAGRVADPHTLVAAGG